MIAFIFSRSQEPHLTLAMDMKDFVQESLQISTFSQCAAYYWSTSYIRPISFFIQEIYFLTHTFHFLITLANFHYSNHYWLSQNYPCTFNFQPNWRYLQAHPKLSLRPKVSYKFNLTHWVTKLKVADLEYWFKKFNLKLSKLHFV